MTLERRTPLRASPRGKGARGERAVIDMLHAVGWSGAYRNFGSGAFGGGDILGGPVGVHIECKYRERCAIWNWLRQAEAEARPTDIPMVVCRKARMQWWAVMPEDELDALFQLTRVTRHTVVHRSQRCPLWALLEDVQGRANGSEVPVLSFSQNPRAVYAAAPATFVFGLLWERERA